MNIELKKIAVYERMSEETTAFNAEIYANGKNIGYAKNDGQGGCTWYHAHEGKKDLMKQAEEYAKTLPPIKYTLYEGGEEHSIDMNLEHLIDELVTKYQTEKDNQKFVKKREKDMIKNIVFGIPNSLGYSIIGWKISLEEIRRLKGGEEKIKEVIAKVKGDLKEGEKILNTNLPKEWIE
jgi:hypothetical protein